MSKPTDLLQDSPDAPAPRRRAFSLRSRLPLSMEDRLNHFRVETKLIFSKAILLLVCALFITFLWFTIQKKIFKEEAVYGTLMVQTLILAILLNMNLWEVERESRAFALLIMRIPSVDRLAWFKLRVSIAWIALLSLPFFLGFGFFVEIPLHRLAGYYVYCMMLAVLATLLVSIVSSFVHNSLAAGIIAVVTFWLLGGSLISFATKVNFGLYLDPFSFPFIDPLRKRGLTTFQIAKYITVNRLVCIAIGAMLYAWFRRRLMKTEKWIG